MRQHHPQDELVVHEAMGSLSRGFIEQHVTHAFGRPNLKK
jgi:hypothetical protein